jgi:glyoxylase-like metal-dependent hydrolase (beta-lactamase superfamily II)
MQRGLSRRAFVTGAAGAAVLGLSARDGLMRTARPQSPAVPLRAARLRERFTQISGAGGNVLLATDADAAVMVDSGASEHSGDLASAVTEHAAGRPVATLFNTHWHLGHTGGNAVFVDLGAEIIAHENTRLWMSTQFNVRWENRTYYPRETEALPTRTFFSSDPQPLVLEAGRRRIEYGQLENAHTDGDIYVFFPDSNVLAAGGAVALGRYPVPDYSTGGWIDGLISSTQQLIELSDADTMIVPGYGPAHGRAHLQAQHEMAGTLRERVAEHMRLGQSAEEMMAQGITDDFDADWGGNELARIFVSNTYEDLAWRGPGGSL